MTAPRVLLKAWEIRPRKSMGQHFLADPNVASMIVDKGKFEQQDTIVEIGAGLGALTVPLASSAKHVYAVEPDRRIAELLKNELLAAGVSNVTIVEEDILRCDIKTFSGPSETPIKVVGNLPYHISSQVIVLLINLRESIESAVLMFQKEVAERLLANPGTKSYGRLSVLTKYCASVHSIAHVTSSSFHPRPKVDSTVVGITFFASLPFPATDERFLFEIVRAAFGKRRKMLKNALMKSDLGFEDRHLSSGFERADIDPQRRAETLSVEEFVRLSNVLKG